MHRGLRRTLLLGLNLFLGATAVAGGAALITGWIKMPASSLTGSPFSDYTIPGVLLVIAVGGTAMLAAWLVHLGARTGVPASLVAGGTIIVFEAVEWSVIGFAWLQAAYMTVGLLIITLAVWAHLAQVRVGDARRRSPQAAP